MGMTMDIMRPDPTLYMSPAEVMAMFNEGSVDVGTIFAPEPIQQPAQQASTQPGQQGQTSDQPNGTGSFATPSYPKMNGLVSSP